jgi:hypothetical protein
VKAALNVDFNASQTSFVQNFAQAFERNLNKPLRESLNLILKRVRI